MCVLLNVKIPWISENTVYCTSLDPHGDNILLAICGTGGMSAAGTLYSRDFDELSLGQVHWQRFSWQPWQPITLHHAAGRMR